VVALNNPQGVATFTIGLLMFLLLLAAMTLDWRQVYGAGLMSIACHLLIQNHPEVKGELGGKVSGMILLIGTAWISAYAGRERRKMIAQVAGETVKRSRLERYFSPSVASLLESREDADAIHQGVSRELTILFSDLRGFTALSETMPSEEVVQLLNDYHAHMVDAIFRFGGTLDKYLGDGIMAYFNAPLGQEDHATRALSCALAMQDELRKFNETRARRGQPVLRMGIGVHTGPAVVGDIGAPQRREFTAIGDPVNLASRLESLTKEKDTDIIISGSTEKLLSPGIPLRSLGHTEVRGKQAPVAIFTPA
jgi:adenylate cyclase